MSEIFERRVEAWLSNGSTPRQRLIDSFHAKRHMVRLPELTVRGFFNVSARIALTAVPFILAWFTENLSAGMAAIAALGILILQGVIHLTNGRFFKTKSDHYDDLSALLDRVAEVMKDMKIKIAVTGAVDPRRRHERAITATLSVIEDYVLHMIAAERGEVTVTFGVYRDLANGEMEILCRNRGSDRPCKEITASEGMLAHRACQRGVEPRNVNDINYFGHKAKFSPTGSKVNYRSFFVLPLYSDEETDPKPYAFITIDCKKPYAFHGERGINMAATLQPYIAHVQQRHRMGEQDVKHD